MRFFRQNSCDIHDLGKLSAQMLLPDKAGIQSKIPAQLLFPLNAFTQQPSTDLLFLKNAIGNTFSVFGCFCQKR